MPVRPLSSELQKLAENEINEIPSRVQEDLNHIREWISKTPHLKARTDDQWLLSFLRGCKFSLQRTKEKLDLFYTVRTLMPEFFSNRDPLQPEIQELLNAGAFIVLPRTAHPAGPRIIIYRSFKLDPEKVKIITVFKLLTMISDILLVEDDNYVVAGDCIIGDLKNVSYGYASQLTPDFCKKVIMCVQDVYPIRVKQINYINVPSIFVTVYNMFKAFIVEKIRNRICFYTEGSLKNCISETITNSVLPKEYGGEEVSCDEIAAAWKLKVESYRDWFLEDAQYCTDETKRPGKPKTVEEMCGVEGSFRKLGVD